MTYPAETMEATPALGPVASARRADRWRAATRILAVRLDNLGDVLMTTPAIAAIRETSPQASVTLLASPSGAALSGHLPFVEGCIAFDAPWVQNVGCDGAAERRLIAQLAERRFDAAVIFTTCTQSALPAAVVCRLAGIPLRLAHCRENPYQLLTDWLPDPDVIGAGMRHEVERQLALVASAGFATADTRLRFAVRSADRSALRQALMQAGVGLAQRYFVVHPGASAASRRYPAERFGSAADSIARIAQLDAIFSGDASEQLTVDAARRSMSARSASVAGALRLGALAALIEGADLLLTNNTGPAHLAAALGTPVVDLYALTNPQHTPWRVESRVLSHDVPCRNCLKSVCPAGHHDCLRRIDPGRVVAAAIELLTANERSGAGVAA